MLPRSQQTSRSQLLLFMPSMNLVHTVPTRVISAILRSAKHSMTQNAEAGDGIGSGILDQYKMKTSIHQIGNIIELRKLTAEKDIPERVSMVWLARADAGHHHVNEIL